MTVLNKQLKIQLDRLNDYKRIKIRNYPILYDWLEDWALRARYLSQKPLNPLHRNEGFAPFFIVAAGRSGTTLLRRILLANQSLHIPPEMDVLRYLISTYKSNQYRPWFVLVGMVLGLIENRDDFTALKLESLRALGLQLLDQPEDKRSLALILDSFYRYHGQQFKQEVKMWGDKTPRNSYVMHQICSVFPDAKFIHLIRDGVDVTYSGITSGLRPDLDVSAGRWRRSVSMAQEYARRHPGGVLTVKYEDLVLEPGSSIHRVCEFIGIDYDETMLNDVRHLDQLGDACYTHHGNLKRQVFTDSIGKGRREMTDGQKQRLQKLIGPELSLFGYKPATERKVK